MDYLQPANFEHTQFASESLPFNCFYIKNANTLPHWHNHTEIVYVPKGGCDLYINGQLFVLNQGDLILIPPSSLHSINPLGISDYYALVIGEHLLDAFIQDQHFGPLLSPILQSRGLVPLCIRTDHCEYDSLFSPLIPIINTDFNETSQYAITLKISLCQFFNQLIRCFPEYATAHHAPVHSHTLLLKKTISYMQLHTTHQITLKMLADICNLSEQHFSRLFKSYTGKTAMTYLALLRLENAHKLLVTTDLPITQIPELTGFCNANYFARTYKTYYGKTPSQSRKMR